MIHKVFAIGLIATALLTTGLARAGAVGLYGGAEKNMRPADRERIVTVLHGLGVSYRIGPDQAILVSSESRAAIQDLVASRFQQKTTQRTETTSP